MPHAQMVEILTRCLGLDQKALATYRKFSTLAKDKELSDFWTHMADEE